jgi:tartrate dehydratase alpha subunit/fumarate hydratase class I-like protein
MTRSKVWLIAWQFIRYYHPKDFVTAMHQAHLREESLAARDAIDQILINSRMCATGHRPIYQDTGIVTLGMVPLSKVRKAPDNSRR